MDPEFLRHLLGVVDEWSADASIDLIVEFFEPMGLVTIRLADRSSAPPSERFWKSLPQKYDIGFYGGTDVPIEPLVRSILDAMVKGARKTVYLGGLEWTPDLVCLPNGELRFFPTDAT